METGESQKNVRVLSSVIFSVPYATHRTFYSPYSTLRSLSYKIKDYRQAYLDSPVWSTTQSSQCCDDRIGKIRVMNNKRAKTNSATRLASGKGTRHCSTALGSATTGKQDSTQTWTLTV